MSEPFILTPKQKVLRRAWLLLSLWKFIAIPLFLKWFSFNDPQQPHARSLSTALIST